MIVTRFAPSPTGHLHLGHALAAMTAHDMALAGHGRFLLRIEDLDLARCREEFVAAILEDLAWLGLEWERPPLHQSQRVDRYRAALAQLQHLEVLYPCFCTRREIIAEVARVGEAPHGIDGPLYPGTCRELPSQLRAQRIAAGEAYALRLDAARASVLVGTLQFDERGQGPLGERGIQRVDPALFGDVVLARKDTPAAYHLAVVVDDAEQGVSRVTRGLDLFAATHVQRLLQALLELPEPEYAHHRLVLDAQGRKLSKRDGAMTLRAWRERGLAPAQLRAMIVDAAAAGVEIGP